MTKEAINQYLEELEEKLLNQSEKISIGLNTSWVNQFPNEAAVYIFRENDTIVHVGETKNLNALMIKLVSTKSIDDNMGVLLHDIKEFKTIIPVGKFGQKGIRRKNFEKG